ncbi:MAG: acyl-CoA/acyl-ACP dehydrogenase [Acidimicrobiia bacterium]|nr:acyl-CoA/acyl-ACP dehydrogenase [Acidimicrobiia bacterium]
MDFSLTEEQEALRGLARQILADRSTLARLKELDASADWFDRDTWAELAKANLLGVAVPEDHGGLGYGFLELCLLLVEVGRAVAPLPALTCLVSGALPLAEFGSEAQRRLLGEVAAGESILTAALVEEGTPSEQPLTTAIAEGDRWRLDGTKVCVPAVHLASAILVPATAGDGRLGVFLVPADAPGLRAERQDTMSHEPWFTVVLDGVTVGADALVGDLDRGAAILRFALDRATVGLCALATGVTEEALRITAEYTTTRRQFGRPIGTFQAVGQRLADASIDAWAIELTMLQAASHLAGGRDVPLEVATAKFWASEGASRVVHAGLHVHGGISIDVDYPIHRYFLWAKQIEATLGSETPQLVRIGRILAGEPMAG